jgi:type I restriction enzyme M protein
MNLYIHDIRNAQLLFGDTLLYPKFKDAEKTKSFEVVIANPPWNQDGYDEVTLKKGEFWKDRFKYGFTPKQSADWAWIEHMMASADKAKGRIGVVIDNGCLFRGGKEKAVRTGVMNDGLLEAVVLLPEKLFYNTGAPGALLFLNKNKSEERKGKIFFINASKEFRQHPEVRKLNQLGDKNIQKIVNAFNNFSEIEGFSRVVDMDEIKENEYNLNVTLYVFPEEEVEDIDVNKEWRELRILEKEIDEVDKKIEGYLKELREEN